MTGFDELDRGDIVWATDPLSEKGRPLLVVGAPRFPNHGVQLITALVSTKTYHEESLVLRDEDYSSDPLGAQSHVLPWSLVTLNSATAVEYHMTSIVDERVEDVATAASDYISS